MTTGKWQLHRAGLVNFWYYDEQDFHFANGKLLLRGTNGSGKSVTMQSFLPFLLDGRKSPDRLDPFGSRARRMEDYLLGEKDEVDRGERTGYLFLEFKREDAEQYLTIGAGLRARRGQSLDFWGFSIVDGRRIGKDLLLYKFDFSNETGEREKIPLTKKDLEQALGQGGKVVESQKEYMDMVNRLLFGFSSTEAYEAMIKLLIQLRSPKLSKDFKPTVIYEILEESLPTTTDEELRPLSETIENMDQIRYQLEQLMSERKSVRRLLVDYDAYNRFVLYEKAAGLVEAQTQWETIQQDLSRLQQTLEQDQSTLQAQQSKLADLNQERVILDNEKSMLQQHEAFQGLQAKKEKESELEQTKLRLKKEEEKLQSWERKERNLRNDIRKQEDAAHSAKREINRLLEELSMAAVEAYYEGHQAAADELQRHLEEDISFQLWRKESRDHLETLNRAVEAARQVEQAEALYNDAEEQVSLAKEQRDRLLEDEQKHETFLEEEQSAFLQEVHRWKEDCREVEMSDEDLRLLSSRVVRYQNPYTFGEIRESADRAYNRKYEYLVNKVSEKRQEIIQADKERKVVETQLAEWTTKQEPEPVRHPDSLKTRSELQAQGIPFIPFYAAVEFKENVPKIVQARLESAIERMGLLDALIVPKEYRKNGNVLSPGMADSYLVTNPQLIGHTLTEFLKPTAPEDGKIPVEDILEVLASVQVEPLGETLAQVSEDGAYSIGLLAGMAPSREQAIYIGKESRRRYRMQMIDQLKNELAEWESRIAGLQTELNELDERIGVLRQELQIFPKEDSMREAYSMLAGVRNQLEIWQRELVNRNEKMKKAFDALQEKRNRFRVAIEGLSLPAKLESLQFAKQQMESYLQLLNDLTNSHKDLRNAWQQEAMYRDQLEEVIFQVDEAKGECQNLRDRIKWVKEEIRRIEQTLQQSDYESIRQRIEQCIDRLAAIPNESQALSTLIGTLEKQIEINQDRLDELEAEKQSRSSLLQTWKTIFEAECRLGFHTVPDGWEGDLPKAAHQIRKQEQGWAKEFDRDKLQGRLNDCFYRENSQLVEYRMTSEQTMEVEIQTEQLDSLSYFWDRAKQTARRILIQMDYQGKRVSPYYVYEQLERDIEEQQIALTAQDRELYEEIIMNSVGRILRSRIYRAEQWVEKINQLMDERDTSSGLKFGLRWKPRSAEHEGQLDTVDLVKLLRKDAGLLNDVDLDRVTSHFRSKIDEAKRKLKEDGHGNSLHQVMKEVLDYRRWFSFQLYYKREGENQKELTNNVFFTFSGGEKAMAMYIPLFTAAMSHYGEARQDAPYIISLDEAFAGVDDNNIRDMFQLVEQLNFNYIMNSQALWGDYDTVSSLSICELVRPKNVRYVTVIRYHWDGRIRRLLDSVEDYGLLQKPYDESWAEVGAALDDSGAWGDGE